MDPKQRDEKKKSKDAGDGDYSGPSAVTHHHSHHQHQHLLHQGEQAEDDGGSDGLTDHHHHHHHHLLLLQQQQQQQQLFHNGDGSGQLGGGSEEEQGDEGEEDRSDLPESRSLILTELDKRFFFDVGNNARGTYLRVSEVTGAYRTALTIPHEAWKGMRDLLDWYIEQVPEPISGDSYNPVRSRGRGSFRPRGAGGPTFHSRPYSPYYQQQHYHQGHAPPGGPRYYAPSYGRGGVRPSPQGFGFRPRGGYGGARPRP